MEILIEKLLEKWEEVIKTYGNISFHIWFEVREGILIRYYVRTGDEKSGFVESFVLFSGGSLVNSHFNNESVVINGRKPSEGQITELINTNGIIGRTVNQCFK